ncbi:MAG: Na+/H+ antiporter NhaA [Candidatus Heimdallarchaeota archaeon]|nr:Na+/H+ antiporter NhaA [Candidatus Heimdallarchaeota archaeon]
MERIFSPFQKFFKYEASSGILLMVTIVVALIWVNISESSYFGVWETYMSFSVGTFKLSKPVYLWINDLLMAIFFLLVGLEVKRELLVGQLRNPRQAMLPIFAAIGGIVIPAGIYLLINLGSPENIKGWAIPAATDIAFALGVLYLLGNKVPVSARVFLATLAIIDDIAAILIIAIFYTGDVKTDYLILAAVMFIILLILNKLHVRRILPYMLVGLGLWYGFFGSGIHATIAGVFLALTIPATTTIDHLEFRDKSSKLINQLVQITRDDEVSADDVSIYMNTIASLEHSCQAVEAPLQRLEHSLAPWVAYLIMPIFALANAGVVFEGDFLGMLTDPISLGIILGLFIGKPLGIFLASKIAVNLGIANLPKGISFNQVIGIGFLAGIGFTMSTFISALAFEFQPEILVVTKVAILVASFLSGIMGFGLLSRTK